MLNSECESCGHMMPLEDLRPMRIEGHVAFVCKDDKACIHRMAQDYRDSHVNKTLETYGVGWPE